MADRTVQIDQEPGHCARVEWGPKPSLYRASQLNRTQITAPMGAERLPRCIRTEEVTVP